MEASTAGTAGTSSASDLAIEAPRYLWETWYRNRVWVRPDGEVVAALRRGVGRAAGTVPQMWPFYRHLSTDGRGSRSLDAEHLALSLIGVHQQSKSVAMHVPGVGVGEAAYRLSRQDDVSPQAVERRFAAAATATSLGEVGVHLRGLITQLRGPGIGLDYTQLVRDLVSWQDPERQGIVRRHWGADYYARRNGSPKKADAPTTTTDTED